MSDSGAASLGELPKSTAVSAQTYALPQQHRQAKWRPGLVLWKGPMLGLMLWCQHLENFNDFFFF